mgnify:CR=1 FL=1
MKLVKVTHLGITTSLDGTLYILSEEATSVSDEVAAKLKEQFLERIEVSDAPEPKKVEVAEDAPSEPKEEAPKKRVRRTKTQ